MKVSEDQGLIGYHRIVAEAWRGDRLVRASHLPVTAGGSILWSLDVSEVQDLIGYHRIVVEVWHGERLVYMSFGIRIGPPPPGDGGKETVSNHHDQARGSVRAKPEPGPAPGAGPQGPCARAGHWATLVAGGSPQIAEGWL